MTLSYAVPSTYDTLIVSYTVPSDPAAARLKDLSDNPVASFTGQAVTNNTAAAKTPLTASIPDEPSSHDGQSEFTFELQFSEEPKEDFSENTLRDHAFTVTGGEVKGARSLVSGSNVRWEITINPASNGDVTIVLPITTDCTDNGAVCTGDGTKLSNRLDLTVSGPAAEQSSQQQQENSAATGSPTISGTAQVGETLTASTTGITDTDGLTNVSYSYQWIANDGTSDSDIADATSSSYTLVAADAGKTIKVKVAFTDDAQNQETRTSAATAAVAAAVQTPLTASIHSEPASHDGQDAFTFELHFSENLEGFSYKTLRDHAFTVTGGKVATAGRLVSGNNTKWRIKIGPTSNGDVTIVLPITTDCADNGAVCNGDSRKLSNRLELTVSGPGSQQSSQQQEENSPATGNPTISGTAQVGETLTASTTGITDADRLTNVSYSYQWIANDGTSDSDIADATASAYTLVAADAGKTIKVKVAFTDDNGNDESLTSTATTAVIAANTSATGAPTISGTVQVDQTLTADTSGIGDADRLTNVSYSYQWIANDGTSDSDIADATSSSYTLVAADAGKTIKVKVAFTDDAQNQETRTSAATAAVAAAVQTPLTASIHSEPASHDGQDAFTFELHFSENLEGFSYKTLRDHAFTVTGGKVATAGRLVSGNNTKWRIKIGPTSNGDVTIVLPITTDCADNGAVCNGDSRKLSNRLELTVSGPGS